MKLSYRGQRHPKQREKGSKRTNMSRRSLMKEPPLSIDDAEELLPLLPLYAQREIEKEITPTRVKEMLVNHIKNKKRRNRQ